MSVQAGVRHEWETLGIEQMRCRWCGGEVVGMYVGDLLLKDDAPECKHLRLMDSLFAYLSDYGLDVNPDTDATLLAAITRWALSKGANP